MDALNTAISCLVDWLLAPLAGAPGAALVMVSMVTGVVMTIVFRYTSNQRALRAAADRTKAMLVGMRLFKDDLRTALRYQGGLIKATGSRLLHSLRPMIVLIVPVALMLVQLAHRFEWRPLGIGDHAVAAVHVSEEAWTEWQHAVMEAPEGIIIETPALRDEAERAVYWRFRVMAPVTEPLGWRAGGTVIEKNLTSAGNTKRLRAISEERRGGGLWSGIMHPIEMGLGADSPIRRIAITHPRRSTPIMGIALPWWGTFLIVSLVTALVVRPIVKVQF